MVAAPVAKMADMSEELGKFLWRHTLQSVSDFSQGWTALHHAVEDAKYDQNDLFLVDEILQFGMAASPGSQLSKIVHMRRCFSPPDGCGFAYHVCEVHGALAAIPDK